MARFLNIVFVVFVFFMLFLGSIPAISKFLRDDENVRSASENRALIGFQSIAKKDEFKSITSAMESATSDQLPLRDLIIQKFRRLQIYGFSHETNTEVMIGQNGHWYQTGSGTLSRIPCAAPGQVSKKNQTHIETVVIDLNEFLRAQGKALSVIIVPLQHTLSPSNLPKPLTALCEERFKPLEDSISRMKDAGVPVFYDVAFMKNEGQSEFYDPRSFHWHAGGAALYSHHAITEGSLSKTGIIPVKLSATLKRVEKDVDMGNYLGIAPLTQNYNSPTVLERFLFRGTVESSIKREQLDEKFKAFYRGAGSRQNYYAETNNESNGRGLIIGDSFSKPAAEFWGRHFSSSITATTNTTKSTPGVFRELSNEFKADHVILILEESKITPVNGGPTWRTIGNMMGPVQDR